VTDRTQRRPSEPRSRGSRVRAAGHDGTRRGGGLFDAVAARAYGRLRSTTCDTRHHDVVKNVSRRGLVGMGIAGELVPSVSLTVADSMTGDLMGGDSARAA
jgi:hypothetical protein